MAIENPPAYLQARIDHKAKMYRKGLAAAAGTTTSIVTSDDSLKVSERGTGANMSVDVAPGTGLVADNSPAAVGTYGVSNDAVLNVPIAAADTLDRIDLVGVRVLDSADNAPDLSDESLIEVVTGTPSGLPAVPSVPATSQFMVLAQVLVPGSTTSILDSNITDVRNVHPVASPSYEMVTFTSSGTFDKSDYPWASKIRVRVIGGGGGSGGTAATTGTEVSGGGGGGGGAYAESAIDIDSVPAAVTVTVGAGGLASNAGEGSSFGSLAVAGGGAAGGTGIAQAPITAVFGSPGAGGTATAGDLQIRGGDASPGFALAINRLYVSDGGFSVMSGAQSRSTAGANGGAGEPGNPYGGGASGATGAGVTVAKTGEPGADGIVIVEIFG